MLDLTRPLLATRTSRMAADSGLVQVKNSGKMRRSSKSIELLSYFSTVDTKLIKTMHRITRRRRMGRDKCRRRAAARCLDRRNRHRSCGWDRFRSTWESRAAANDSCATSGPVDIRTTPKQKSNYPKEICKRNQLTINNRSIDDRRLTVAQE